MSQLIACKTKEGLVLATDSKAVDVDQNGNLIELKVDRMHQLSEHTVILNGGAANGELMCHALKNFVHDENLQNVDDIYLATMPFLATEYERFMRSTCKVVPIDPIHQVSFILGGYTDKNAVDPFHLYLIWNKRKLPLLDSDEIGISFAVPRIIKLEHRLFQLVNQNAEMDRIMTTVRGEMEKLAASNEEVSEPLAFATITKEGFRKN